MKPLDRLKIALWRPSCYAQLRAPLRGSGGRGAMKSVEEFLARHPFSRGLDPQHAKVLVDCASIRELSAGDYLWRQGETASQFFLIESGEVAIGILIPHQGLLQIDSVGSDEVVGWSWFAAPYRSYFDARALSPVRALALQADRLRELCETHRELRCELLSRIAPIIVRRLEASQRKLIEVHSLELAGPRNL